MRIIRKPSPNYFTGGLPIKAVCLHGTAGGLPGSIATLLDPRIDNPNAAVSANYVIDLNGVVYELVDWYSGRRAWANGRVENYDKSIKWLLAAVAAKTNINLLTVSIEHVASREAMERRASMPDLQFNSSIELTASILRANSLKASHETIIGHNQISGTVKYNCPGVIFPPAYTEVLILRNHDLQP